MKITPKKRRLLFKILPYPVIFLVGGWMYFIVEYGLLEDSLTYPDSENPYSPLNSLVSVSVMSIIVGIGIGFLEELIFKNRFKTLAFSRKLIIKTSIYVFILVTIMLAFTILLLLYNTGRNSIDAGVIEDFIPFITSFGFISILIFSGFVINMSLFFREIVDYLGFDIVSNFFSGKYSKPVYENRIFMFLDMKDSTAIAEKIGHEKQYELINAYFGDMSDAIVRTEGTIYQYVGDEIVISWELDDGLKNCNCLNCFLLIEEQIASKSEEYILKFGEVPGFKAGLHYGEVTRGRVGDIKRDLLYIGDVLNATARIQGLCNELKSRLLISAQLKEALPENNFEFKPIGEVELKGRQKKEELYSVVL
ncbi:MAG: adenylate/guanylate cyclase domain-containing protein [Bacteroidota bacterium]